MEWTAGSRREGKYMKKEKGRPLPLGVTIEEDRINFAVAIPEDKKGELLLYQVGTQAPCEVIPLTDSVGEVYFLALTDIKPSEYEYNYRIAGEIVVDPYVRALAGKEQWKRERDLQKHEVRGRLCEENYNWEKDRPLGLPYHKVVAYSIHVRGFTKHSSSKVTHKGTFAGVIEKIPYLCELGINQLHCMPVYEFEECQRYTNYWGYGDAYCFAPKSAYAACGDGVKELKDMVKACHKASIEVVLEMPFTDETPKQMMEECLRYYMMEYHIDGFILNPLVAPVEAICADPILKKSKIMKHELGFQTVMRRFLKGDEGMVNEAIFWLRHVSTEEGIYNYVAGQSGFTLNDVVSYDGKHNEKNGENNQDGPDYNYSWNCGAEGPTRKKEVVELRKRQIRNAFFLLLFAQGTPCILSGDEFGNTQNGNNNVYCQDNPTAWIDWSKREKEQALFQFVKGLIEIRKCTPIFGQKDELRGMDQMSCGIPDISYHGESAWRVPSEISSRQLGVYYSGAYIGGDDYFIAYNMHWLLHSFALPVLSKGRKWYKAVSTNDGILKNPELLKNQRMMELNERTVILLVGR